MKVQSTSQWTGLRHDYYVAGRTLLFSNQMQLGVLILGYAIEAHMKQLLAFHGSVPGEVTYSHDFRVLYDACRQRGMLTDVEVSDDFLLFVGDNFHRRYPSQTNETVKRANV